MPYTLAAYIMWGFFPAFFPLLAPASATEVLAHRILWTALFVTGWLMLAGRISQLTSLTPRQWAWMAACGSAISINWIAYVVAVNNNHVADAALGYFINPLVSVALGMLVLREKLSRGQALAVGVAVIAVLWLSFMTDQVPWLALILAGSFGLYGLLKKQAGVASTTSVAAEALIMTPLALLILGYLAANGNATIFTGGTGHALLLMSSGIVTALPLLCFAHGAKFLPLTTIGMLQYITPIMQMLWAVLVNNEYMSTERWIGFGIIWLAVAIYLADLVQSYRRRRAARAR